MSSPNKLVPITTIVAILIAGVLIALNYWQPNLFSNTDDTLPPDPALSSETENSGDPEGPDSEEPAIEPEEDKTENPEETQSIGVIPEQPGKGDPDAPVKIIEFAEFFCPFCARHNRETMPRLKSEYIDQGLVFYEFHNYIVHGEHALTAAAAGECAHLQGGFWEFHDLLFDAVSGFGGSDPRTLEGLEDLALEAGLSGDLFHSCLYGHLEYQAQCTTDLGQCTDSEETCRTEYDVCTKSDPIMSKIELDKNKLLRMINELPQEERDQVTQIGIPMFFINGKILIGAYPFETFQEMIEAALAEARNSS